MGRTSQPSVISFLKILRQTGEAKAKQ
jgi:hypothetical protein